MQTVETLPTGKNKLWIAYRDANPVVRAQIMYELKQVGLFRHWMVTASKESHDLFMAKAPLRDVFLKAMPECAPLFGINL